MVAISIDQLALPLRIQRGNGPDLCSFCVHYCHDLVLSTQIFFSAPSPRLSWHLASVGGGYACVACQGEEVVIKCGVFSSTGIRLRTEGWKAMEAWKRLTRIPGDYVEWYEDVDKTCNQLDGLNYIQSGTS